jgi:tRNA splicing ligase
MAEYQATDDDLPDNFWEGVTKDDPLTQSSENARRAAVLFHYPEIRVPASQQRRREAAIRSEREFSLTERKVYVKISKKLQMWDWLQHLFEPDTIVKIENANELRFLTATYARFYRYTPFAVKWVTRKQYEWLRHIACQYLKVPE